MPLSEDNFQIQLCSGVGQNGILETNDGPIADATVIAQAMDLPEDRIAAETDENGHFMFPALRETEYALVLLDEVLVLSNEDCSSTYYFRPDSSEVLRPTVVKGFTVSGVVRDAQTGQGIPNAPVAASPRTNYIQYFRGAHVGPHRSILTDLGGRYELSGLGMESYVVVVGQPEGYAHNNPHLTRDPRVAAPYVEGRPGGRTENVDFMLHPKPASPENPPEETTVNAEGRATVSGVVLNADDTPRAGCVIGVFRRFDTRRYVTTDGSGLFRFDGLLPGNYHLSLRAMDTVVFDGNAPSFSLAQGEHREGVRCSVLERTVSQTIKGTVTKSDGLPASGAYVLVVGGEAVMTDANGSYTAASFTGERHEVRVAFRGHSEAIDSRVIPEANSVDFVLKRRGQIHGRVVTAGSHKPITQFAVDHPLDYRLRICTPDGTFVLKEVDAGKAKISFAALGHVSKSETVTVIAGAVTEDVVIELEPGAVVTGTVATAGGQALAGTQIYEGAAPTNRTLSLCTTDASGAFRVDTLKEEPTTLWATYPGYLPQSVEVSPKEDEPQQVELVLEAGCKVSGGVTEDGSPVADARVYVEPVGARERDGLPEATTDAEGRYVIDGVPRGARLLCVEVRERDGVTDPVSRNPRWRGLTRTVRRLFSPTGPEVEISVDFGGPSGTICGTIEPANATITVRSYSDDEERELVLNAIEEGGSYTLDNVPAGKVHLRTEAPRSQAAIATFEVAADEVATKDVVLESARPSTGYATVEGVITGILPDAETGVALVSGEVAVSAPLSWLDVRRLALLQNAHSSGLEHEGLYRRVGSAPGTYTLCAYSIAYDESARRHACVVIDLGKNARAIQDLHLRGESVEEGTPVTIPDPNLEAALRRNIPKVEGDITDADLRSMTTFQAENMGIVDLTGLEHGREPHASEPGVQCNHEYRAAGAPFRR